MKEEQISHYFDWASTSPCDKQILQEALDKSSTAWGNPSSVHSAGKEARTLLENAREDCAKVLGVKKENLFFTSGGTESDHIPLLSLLNRPNKGTVLFSSIEHPAVREMALELKKCGMNIVSIPSDKNGIITPEAVKNLLTSDTVMVCVMAVNNETGAIQPVKQIADVITEFGKGRRKPKFHVDCVQACGKIPLDISYSGIDSAAFSAHKICGPRGIGLLYLKDVIEPFLKGGGQEQSIRSGTENLFGALAFAKVLQKYYLSEKNPESIQKYETQCKITNEFVKKLSELTSCTIIPPSRLEKPELYSPWVIQAAFNKIPGQVMLRALDNEGFYISTGSACSSRKNNRPVLEAMNIPSTLSENAVRFSFGPLTTEQGINELFNAVKTIAEKFN